MCKWTVPSCGGLVLLMEKVIYSMCKRCCGSWLIFMLQVVQKLLLSAFLQAFSLWNGTADFSYMHSRLSFEKPGFNSTDPFAVLWTCYADKMICFRQQSWLSFLLANRSQKNTFIWTDIVRKYHNTPNSRKNRTDGENMYNKNSVTQTWNST